MIKYHKMSLFDAPVGSILVHAANAEGIWGSGIAAEIKKRYPNQEEFYKKHALLKNIGYPICDMYTKDNHYICNLLTSSLDSKNPDKEVNILINTTLAVNNMLKEYKELGFNNPIYSNKFNSGIFNVPWEKTERIIEILSERYGVTWNVCDPNPDT